MKLPIRRCLLLVLCVFSAQSFSSDVLGKHVLAVSQSMSAFYMYSLSEGDKRYKNEYEQYFDDAEGYLVQFKKSDALVGNELQSHWDKLRPELKYEYIDGSGFIIPVSVRNQYRAYLSKIFSQYSLTNKAEQDVSSSLENMAINVEVMSARFFDISSALYGTMSISTTDKTINPINMAKVLNTRFDQLQASIMDEKIKRNLRLVQTKWRFIEDSVINYEGEAAYLLVYYNKSQINKILHKSQRVLAGV